MLMILLCVLNPWQKNKVPKRKEKPLVRCAYQELCNSTELTVLEYRYEPGKHITYEILCRECKRRSALSINLTLK